jgi:hypothetical protein
VEVVGKCWWAFILLLTSLSSKSESGFNSTRGCIGKSESVVTDLV